MPDHPAEAPDLHTLIEEARGSHYAQPGSSPPWCWLCSDESDPVWPCLPAQMATAIDAQAERLARALEQADVAQRSAEAWEQNYNTLNGEIMAGIERQLTEARAEAAAQRGRAKRMEKWARSKGHEEYCAFGIRVSNHDCICGLSAALAPVEPAS